jgi:hypothetical protein
VYGIAFRPGPRARRNPSWLMVTDMGETPRAGVRFWMRASVVLAKEPRLWPTAAAQAGRLAPPGWWRRAPFLPVPDAEYLRFRLDTQYGATGDPDPEDLVTYLRWCRDGRRESGL